MVAKGSSDLDLVFIMIFAVSNDYFFDIFSQIVIHGKACEAWGPALLFPVDLWTCYKYLSFSLNPTFRMKCFIEYIIEG